MSSITHWQRVETLFLEAVDLSPAERARFLSDRCGDDPLLRLEMESLLAADTDGEAAIDAVVQTAAANLFDSQTLIGEHLGLYRIVRELGRGGMGTVYLAVRDDAEFSQQVAIKIVRRGMDTNDVLERFRSERQILANLDHIYIARLFDGGSTAAGVPFFVMEWVQGKPVDVFCREQAMGFEAVCRLFLLILQAVSYAHRNLVVHRDLKPANILITAEGLPKLLDFGVAKLLTGDGGDTRLTGILRPFTPEYASPEQVQGLPINISTDVYSLGAIFYELLVGKRAQQFAAHTPAQIERVVCQTEVARPGLQVRGLSPDLDNIVLKALRKEPDRRYQSADQLADDIRRYLERRPVLARPDSLRYRCSKFLQRNWLEVVGAGGVAASLVVALVISLGQTHRADRERHTADDQRRIAEQQTGFALSARDAELRQRSLAEEQRGLAEQQRLVADAQRDHARQEQSVAEQRLDDIMSLANSALFDVHDTIATLPGSMAARKTLVKTTLDYLNHLESQVGLDDKMRYTLAGAYFKVAMIQGDPQGASLQDFTGAETDMAKAQALILPAFQRNPGDPRLMLRWMEIHAGLGDLMFRSGRNKESMTAYEELIPIARRLTATKPCDAVCDNQEQAIEGNLAYKLLASDSASALQHADRAMALGRAALLRHPGNEMLLSALGSVTAAAGGALRGLGRLEEAARDYDESIAAREQLLVIDPHNNTIRRNLLIAYGNYAVVLGIPWSPNLGRPDDARKWALKGVAVARETASIDTNDVTARRDLAMILGRSGMIDPEPGEGGTAKSLAGLTEAHLLFEPILAANPKSAETANQFASILQYEARRQAALHRVDESTATYRRSMALLEPFLDGQVTAIMLQYIWDEQDLALLLASSGDLPQAAALASRALAQTEKLNGAAPKTDTQRGALAQSWSISAQVQSRLGKTSEAQQAATNAVRLWGEIKSPGVLSQYRQQIPGMAQLSNVPILKP